MKCCKKNKLSSKVLITKKYTDEIVKKSKIYYDESIILLAILKNINPEDKSEMSYFYNRLIILIEKFVKDCNELLSLFVPFKNTGCLYKNPENIKCSKCKYICYSSNQIIKTFNYYSEFLYSTNIVKSAAESNDYLTRSLTVEIARELQQIIESNKYVLFLFICDDDLCIRSI